MTDPLTKPTTYTCFIFEDDNRPQNSYWYATWHTKKVVPRLDRIKRFFKMRHIYQLRKRSSGK